MVKKLNIKEKKAVNVYFIGDIHVGSNTCDKKSLQKTINIIKNDKQARVILMGDHGEYITPSDTRRYDKDCVDKKLDTFEKQTNYILNSFLPIRDKIYGVLRGNHEAAFAKYHKEEYEEVKVRDESEFLANEFKTNYLEDMGIITLTVGRKKYNILTTHGSRGGTKLAGQIKVLEEIMNMFEISPDVITMGHVHSLQTIVNPKLTFNFKTKVKHLGLTGTYFRTYIKNNINYASSNLYSPVPIGCIMYSFDTKGNIKDNKIIF